MALDTSTARSDIAKIYIAAFNRVPDSDGLNFWVNAYLNGASLTSIASGFATSTEYTTKYPSYQTNTEYVAAVYQNVFGRAVDTGGSKFWTDALDAGTLTKAGLLNSLVSAAAANGSTDGARLTNQAEFGVYCASNNIQWTNATTALSAITSDTATVTTAKTTVSTNEANTSHILTTGQDTPIGTSGNDEFRAVAGATIGTQDQTTLNSSDVIDGGAGTDTLIVNMTGATYSGGARIKNIETLKIGTNLAAATFDYNVNAGSNEVTEVTKIVADQINTGEALTVNNIVKTSGALPKLSWENDSNTANAGIVNYNYRAAELTGTTDKDNQAVDLKSVTNGVLNLAAGIETVSLTSVGTERVTLNNSTNTDTTGTGTPYNNTADLVSNGTLTKVVLAGTAEIGKVAGNNSVTGLSDRASAEIDGTGGVTGTVDNLLSVEARVTEVDASAATAAVNVVFDARFDAAAQNVTFKGGAGNDYVEFKLGDVTATGGAGNDTFAFITQAAGVTNSTFGAADNITGGAGTDTIQISNKGVGTYNIALSEFANKTGVDVLDLRGATNNVTLSSSFVSASDAGLTVTTDNVIIGGTAPIDTEYAMVNTLDLTNLNAGQGITLVGGQGSDRVILNDATFTNAMKLNGGSHTTAAGVSTTGHYDTLTFVNGGVMDRNDLANISGFEGLNLVKNVTGAVTARVELTKAFMAANTAATNSTSTSVDDTVFKISSVAGANGTKLAAGDTVTVDITDLLNSARTAIDSTVTGRIDLTSVVASGATVNYVVDGNTASAAQVASVTLTDVNAVDVSGSAANNTLTYAYTGTSAADAYTLVANADNVTMLAGNDTLTITAATAALTGSLLGGDGTADTITITAATNISGATIAGFETMTGNFTNTMTAAQYAAMTITDTAAITLSNASTSIVAQTTSPVLTLANGTNTVDATGTANYNLTGGTGVDTFNFGAALTATDTVAGGTGTDVLTVTGTATGSANITAIETIQVNYATAATFKTGAIANGASNQTITAAGSTAAATIDAVDWNTATAVGAGTLTIIDGAGNDTITVADTAADRNVTTVTLSTGGADQIIIKNTAGAGTTNEVTINNFTTGIAAGADTIDFLMKDGTVNHTSYQVVTATATNELATASIIEINSAVGTVTAFDAGAAGLVGTLIASAIGNSATGTSGYIIYGSGAMADKAALYEAVSTAGGADTTTANITVELVAVFNNVTADSFVIGNFA